MNRQLGLALAATIVATVVATVVACDARPAAAQSTRLVPVGTGWARSSVNTAMFRTSSVVSRDGVQYTAYYDSAAHVVLARRAVGDDRWAVRRTPHMNDVADAHNAIALAVDGRGVLHVAWAEHDRPLRYARAVRAGALDLGAAQAMTGRREAAVTYPQFTALPDGDLLFVYRDGRSGSGDVLLNRYDVRRQAWRAVAHPLVSGEGVRNAYVNPLVVDARGGWHLSWCWRESPDVATNHDLLYAYSPDEGRTWQTSHGRPYTLPITARTAEVAWRVPQGRELINQTSMAVDTAGRPMIATYWRPEGTEVPQFQLVWHDGAAWRASQVGRRAQPFRLSGGGTKRIPVSRPLVVAGRAGAVHVVFRDEERGGGITAAISTDPARATWRLEDIHSPSLGQWEPTHDPDAWRREQRLHLFVQRVGQGDGERLDSVPPQPVSILEWNPSSATGAAPALRPPAQALDAAVRAALDTAARRYRHAARTRDPAAGYPRSTAPDGSWRTVPFRDWTSGFFPGTLWYLHAYTRDPELRAQAERWTRPLAAITAGTYDHDLGFQYHTSFGNALRITGDARFRAPLLDAARHLAGRFDPRVGAIRSWSWGEWRYPVIVDNLMNLELLFWGAAHGGEARWRDVARAHAAKTMATHMRPDGGSFHVVDHDTSTGAVVRRMTRQGFADSSTWARGQAWAIYGFTMAYRETRDPRFLATARRAVAYVLPRLPADGVPCWDYQAPGCPDRAPRDASAAAIMASALLELSTLTSGEESGRHRAAAERMLGALTSPSYLGQGADRQSVLVHAVGDLPRNGEVDVGINYADYYLVEALLRYLELRGATELRVLPRPSR